MQLVQEASFPAKKTLVRSLSCCLSDFDFVAEISQTLSEPGRRSFVIQAQEIKT